MQYKLTQEIVSLRGLEDFPSLSSRTSAFYQQYLQKEKSEVVALKDECLADLITSGIGETCLQVGDRISNFMLPNIDGKLVNIEMLLKRGPLVISFYRGSWCGFCNLEMRALQEAVPFIRDAGGDLIAISPDISEGTRDVSSTFGIDFEILTDKGNVVAKAFGLSYVMDDRLRPVYKDDFDIDIPGINGDDTWNLPITATYVVNTEGYIVKAFTNPDHTQRLEPSDIVLTLYELASTTSGA